MKASLFAKSALANLLCSCRIPQSAIRKRAGKRYPILMYHRVVPAGFEEIPIQAGMYVEPDTFEAHIGYLKRHFRLIPFSKMFSTASTGENRKPAIPPCILTFDDGWRDIFDFAYPILKRHRAPATVFLPTRYIGTQERFWSDRLAYLLASGISPAKRKTQESGPVESALERIASLPGGNERRLESAISLLKEMGDREIEEVLTALKEMAGVGDFPRGRVFLDWDEIREMKGSGLVSFGSHTHNHRILVHLREEEVRKELNVSKEILLREGAADPSFIPFCYPNGDWNDRIAQRVREAGYHASVTTENGWNEETSTPFELKRLAIHQDMTRSGAMFGCRVAEIL